MRLSGRIGCSTACSPARRRLIARQHRDPQVPTIADLTDSTPQGPFALSGPAPKVDPRAVPLRGDLAHIGLAGKHFVPHYAVPQPRTVMPGGASLLANPGDSAEELCALMEGDSFEVLDVTGGWAWGCLGLGGPVGYIKVDRLEALP